MKRGFELTLLLLCILLTAVGLLTVYSAGGPKYFVRQLLYLPLASAALIAAFALPRRFIYGLAGFFYGLMLLLLVAVALLGTGPGSRRWFQLGPVSFQPSEFAKLAVILMLAKHLSIHPAVRLSPKTIVVPLLIALVPAGLVAAEPDLSSAAVFLAILALQLYWNGMRPLHLFLLCSPLISFVAGLSLWTWVPFFVLLAVLLLRRMALLRAILTLVLNSAFGLVSPFVYASLKDYQQERIRNFFAPWFDPHGLGWNAVQSQIAIGSGRLFGKGWLHGSQGRLGFLPNRHTDFAFSVIAEDFGFVGCVILLGLFAWLIRRLLVVGRASRDTFGSLLCAGCAAVIGFQVFVNVGMLLGLLPITGITLPFISYGGSSLVATLALIGLALNVASRPE